MASKKTDLVISKRKIHNDKWVAAELNYTKMIINQLLVLIPKYGEYPDLGPFLAARLARRKAKLQWLTGLKARYDAK